ncbi:MAG: S-methyl-5'-thioinosine phosphorylase [Gammaproteobacteria bacterium]|nr:MAG: S-methyl-5'-thioinosine phosphorylase [Gammaproteobacteria bacterium]
MSRLGIIGGTGLTALEGLKVTRRTVSHTPYGEPSAPLTYGDLNGKEVAFLPRHGASHTIPPHKINYRANIQALSDAGITDIIAVAAVGGISEEMAPGRLAVPDQIIDYTWGRKSTFFEDGQSPVVHIDFTHPYDQRLREMILQAASKEGIDIVSSGVYGATQGPRLETAAEIARMERDGCTLVGMTGMPEAALAREVEINYACIAVSANWAAGKTSEVITMESIEQTIRDGMARVRSLLARVIERMDEN